MSAISNTLRGVIDRFMPDAERLAEEQRQKRAKDKQTQRNLDIKWLMSSAAGRRIFYDLMEKSYLMGSTIVDGKASDLLEGRRALGRELLMEIIASEHEAWLLSQKEALENAINARKA